MQYFIFSSSSLLQCELQSFLPSLPHPHAPTYASPLTHVPPETFTHHPTIDLPFTPSQKGPTLLIANIPSFLPSFVHSQLSVLPFFTPVLHASLPSYLPLSLPPSPALVTLLSAVPLCQVINRERKRSCVKSKGGIARVMFLQVVREGASQVWQPGRRPRKWILGALPELLMLSRRPLNGSVKQG